MDKKIAKIVVGLPIEGPFDYSIPREMVGDVCLGQRVWVPFGSQKRQGVIVGFTTRSRFKELKMIFSLIDKFPTINGHFLELTRRISEYYGCSWGEAIETVLPDLLRKGKQQEESQEVRPQLLNLLSQEKSLVTLLHALDWTAAWHQILEMIKNTLQQNRGIIFLVPEIVLIDNILSRLKEQVTVPISVLDKTLTPKNELREWMKIKAGESRLVLGTRSAVFAPVKDLGLILVYQEENHGYKQEQSPFYHARQIALMRSAIEGVSVGLVSAVPMAESWFAVQKKKINYRSFPSGKLASLMMIDLGNYKSRKASFISFSFRNHIEKTLKFGGRILIWMNRRGFSLLTCCPECKFTFKCERCDINLIYSYAKKKLICRHCNKMVELPLICPQCKKSYLKSMGTGIEKLESEVARIFPQARIASYDKDTEGIPDRFDILIGTQAVFKIIDRLNIQLAGVIHMDAELNRHDLRANERAMALLVHLRQSVKEQVCVQTHLIDHHVLKAARKMDFRNFYKQEFAGREELGFPPFNHLVAIGLRSVKEEQVVGQAFALHQSLQELQSKQIEIMDPHPDMVPKLRDKYRFTILLKGKNVASILAVVKKGMKGLKRKSGVTITVNVDPY